jgi:hypothetical protein
MSSLKFLFERNLTNSIQLGLVEEQPAVTALQEEVRDKSGGLTGKSCEIAKDREAYRSWMLEASEKLDQAHRPLNRPLSSGYCIEHVTTLGTFGKHLAEPLSASCKVAPFANLLVKFKELADLEYSESTDQQALDLGVAYQRAFAKNGKYPVPKDLLLADIFRDPQKFPIWVSPSTPPLLSGDQSTAQFWRDRLGLIHYPDSATGVRVCGEMLVHLQFEVAPNMSELSERERQDWLAIRNAPSNQSKVWLLRPAIVHMGNRRWLQSHADDWPAHSNQVSSKPVASRHGMTAHLADAAFDNGVPELLLDFGLEATIALTHITVLQGLPCSLEDRDESDTAFVQAVAKRPWMR